MGEGVIVGARHAVPLQSAKADFVCMGTLRGDTGVAPYPSDALTLSSRLKPSAYRRSQPALAKIVREGGLRLSANDFSRYVS